MNKAMRMLVMAGMAVAAGATFGAGPAMAATSSTTPSAPHATQTRVVGYFHTLSACRRAGNIGEFRKSWDDHTCIRARGGFHRGQWALAVVNRPHFPGHGPIHHGPVMHHAPIHHAPMHQVPQHH